VDDLLVAVDLAADEEEGALGAVALERLEHAVGLQYRAVVEGWALAADNAMQELGDRGRLQEVVCIGGGSNSALWVRVKASLLGREVYCRRTPEIVAVGAALLAGQAPEGPGPVTDWNPSTSVISPIPEWVPLYRSLSRDFMRAASSIHPSACSRIYP